MSLFNRSRCYNGGNQHRFTGRYSDAEREKKIELSTLVYSPFDAPEVLEALKDANTLRVYVGDICIWCGATKKP